MINDNIEITIVEAKNGVCKIAIEADKDVKIYREEIYLQVKLSNMLGKTAHVKSVDSVEDLIKKKSLINKNVNNDIEISSEEILIEKNKKSTVRINKNNEK